MILCTSASPEYFDDYFDLWASQCNKFYPELKKHIALFKPSEKDIEKCKLYGVETTDLSHFIDKDEPSREYFFCDEVVIYASFTRNKRRFVVDAD